MTKSERVAVPSSLFFIMAGFSSWVMWICVSDAMGRGDGPALVLFNWLCAFMNAFAAALNLRNGTTRVYYGLKLRRLKRGMRASLIAKHGPEEGERLFRAREFEVEGENSNGG